MCKQADPIDKHVGNTLRNIRYMRGMTQEELARHLGVKFQQVQKYETGMNRVSASRLYRAARALDAKVSDFFPAEDNKSDLLKPHTIEMIKMLETLTPAQIAICTAPIAAAAAINGPRNHQRGAA
jgi:transcriptional regulator with XRE-family HTH domain